MSHPKRCPAHAQPDADLLHAWPCPDECEHFLAELERRIEDVQIHGNFTRLSTDENGTQWWQTFRNHQPIDEPKAWRTPK